MRAPVQPDPSRIPSPRSAGSRDAELPANPAWSRLTLSDGAVVQPKLRLGRVDDPAEREADRVAEAVVGGGIVQRCACEEDDQEVRRKEGGSQARPHPDLSPATESPIASLRGGGQPLTAAQRAYFEPHFGELSGVRLHTGPGAQEAARGIAARAFTVGRDIAFGAGEYQPDSPAGQKLLAHELTHTVQQGATRVVRRQPTERRQPTLEEQAATIEGILAREVVSAHDNGWDGVAFVVTHRGTWLEPTSMEKLGAQEKPPAGTRTLGETAAAAMVTHSVGTVLDAGKGASYRIVVGRGQDPQDRSYRLQSWRLLTRPEGSTIADPKDLNEVTSVASEGQCSESDPNYGECLVDERRRAYQEGILAAGQVADAYYNPFSGGGGGVADFGPFKLWRLKRLKRVARTNIRRHSGGGMPYRVIGPHGRLQGTSVYVLRSSDGTVLYVGKGETMNRLRSHIGDRGKTDWFGDIAGVEVRATGLNNTQALALEENLIGQMKPLYNKDLTPFQKEFGTTLSLGANLPRTQQSLWFHVILGE